MANIDKICQDFHVTKKRVQMSHQNNKTRKNLPQSVPFSIIKKVFI